MQQKDYAIGNQNNQQQDPLNATGSNQLHQTNSLSNEVDIDHSMEVRVNSQLQNNIDKERAESRQNSVADTVRHSANEDPEKRRGSAQNANNVETATEKLSDK